MIILALTSFMTHAIPPYRMSCSFHTLAVFRPRMYNAQHKMEQEAGLDIALLLVL